MVIKILGRPETPAFEAANALIKRLGHTVDDGGYFYADLAVAPLLTRIVSENELQEPVYGTLIFHPSPLPYGRGASSIRWAYRRREPVTAATWFWTGGRLDAGDICEQEIVKIDYDMRPREFYEKDIIPAMLRTLERTLANFSEGIVRKVPQVERYATFDERL